MSTDPRTEPFTASLIFQGIILMSINKDNRLETGMIKCENHDPRIEITELESGEFKKVEWPEGHDLVVRAVNPSRDGITMHKGGDFGVEKIIDIEGPDLHKGPVEVNTAELEGRRIGVTAGKLYTYELGQEALDLVKWRHPDEIGEKVKELGHTADKIGLNILCEPGGLIEIIDIVTGAQVTDPLKAEANKKYRIDITNDCEDEEASDDKVGSDFRFYYKVIQGRTDEKFDVREVGRPAPSPGICESALLSRTKSLGLNW